MTIGYYGNIIFETSDNRILTFTNFSRNSTSRIEEHKLLGKKPLIEYCGPELEKVTFTINLNASNGINPDEELKKWRDYNMRGIAHDLIIGGNIIGYDKFIIESLSETYNTVYKNGFLYTAKVDISLCEYITDSKMQPKSMTKKYAKLDYNSPYYNNISQIPDNNIKNDFISYSLPVNDSINPLLSLIKQ